MSDDMTGVLDMDGGPPEPTAPTDLRPLEKREVEAIVAWEIKDSINYYDTEVAQAQKRAMNYYHARKFGNEIKGRSQIVMSDVRDAVEWIMPPVMRRFFGSRHVVQYRPRGAEDEEWARQLTDYSQFSLRSGTSGFLTHHDWFKDSLLEKVGAVLIRWDDTPNLDLETYDNLGEEELDELLAEEGVEVVELDTKKDTIEPPIDEETGQPQLNPETMQPLPTIDVAEYKVKIRRTKPRGRLVFDGIPQAEFLIASRARKMDDQCPFVGRRRKATFSELKQMGIPVSVIDELPESTNPPESHSDGDAPVDEVERTNRPDWASREIWLTECWIRVDEDGDGYSELRRILAAGGDDKVEILEDEEVAFIPIATLCPIPIPHKFYGFSLADLIMDLQILRSMIVRNLMDNVYNTTNQRYVAVEGEVDIETLLSSSPGGVVIAQSSVDNVKVLEQPQMSIGAWNLLEYLHSAKEERTGVNRASQGQSSGVAGETASGVASLLEQSNLRVEMIIRIFAETGVSRAYELIPRILAEADVKDQVIRLRDEFVTIDAKAWRADVDVEVEVGLGTSQSAVQVDNMMMLFDVQQKLMEFDGRMVTPANVFNAIERIPEAMGFAAPEMFFTEPDPNEPIPEKDPDPKVLEVQASQESEMVKLQIERETLQFRREQMMLEAQLKREEMKTRERVALIQGQFSVQQAGVNAGSNEKTAAARQETDLAREALRVSGQADIARSNASNRTQQ